MRATARKTSLGGHLSISHLAAYALALLIAPALSAAPLEPEVKVEPTAPPSSPPEDTDLDSAEPEASTPPRPDIDAVEGIARMVRDFLGGTLEADVEPSTLFDIEFTDDDAVRVEAERLRGVIARAEPPPVETQPPTAAKAGRKRQNKRKIPKNPDSESSDTPAETAAAPPDPALFAARIDLDKARLEFYTLAPEKRAALLERHEARQEAARKARLSAGLTEAELRAKEAEAERQRAVEAAQRARSEAVRLLEEERARLLAVSRAQANFEADLARKRLALEHRGEQTLAFRRQVREMPAQSTPDSAAADHLYDELRAFLRASRDELDLAISRIFSASKVPSAVGDQLGELPEGIDSTEIEKLVETIGSTKGRLTALEAVYRTDHASQLYQEVKALNLQRLSLLDGLTEEKRKTITGFTYGGLDQAVAEIRQVTLVLRYHISAVRTWLKDLLSSENTRSGTAFVTGFTALKWLLLLGAFGWWRRRSDALLTQWRERVQQEERRMRKSEPGLLYRFLRVFQRIRGPLEWLAFLWLLVWLLPKGSIDHLEVRLVTTIFTWILGGSFAVSAVDSIARGRTFSYGKTKQTSTDQIRLRSLKLAGHTVVVLGLLLALSAQLVGKGTVYSWALSLSWVAAIPVILVIIRWWRDIIFQRVIAVRKKKPFHRWVEAHQTGWKSFPAAVTAGFYLFVAGGLRAARSWFTSFDLTRRGLAYLFRRGMDRLAEEQKHSLSLQPLPDEIFVALGPMTVSESEINGNDDKELEKILERVSSRTGGVFAVVGERGRGKTTVLRRVARIGQDVVMVDCPATGLEGLREAIAQALGAAPAATLEECAAQMDAPGRDACLFIDHAHRLIHPTMGGLADFDRLLEIARSFSDRLTWCLTLNEVIWRFLERARGSRPLFDDVIALGPWREEKISSLLSSRCRQAGIDPIFDLVMDPLPEDADDIDRAEALERVRSGYHRMIWDYSAGNAGVALHTWRRSLGTDAQGRICVKLFRVPDARELEELPDHAAFLFRAVIQLEPALAEDVIRTTMLRPSQVEDLLRYGTTHGYFDKADGRYSITWAWFRPITRFLQRRHLLANF